MVAEGEISSEEIAAVLPKVARAIADALAREPEECRLDSRLIIDLGAESIDLLDIVFRLERSFKIKIPRNQIIKEAQGQLTDEEFERKGVITDAGRARLQKYLSEVPPSEYPPVLRVEEVPRLFNVETFCRIVARALREQDKVA